MIEADESGSMAYERANQALICFENAAQMEVRLAGLIADRLALSLKQRGSASLALSGGNTPRGLYALLSTAKLDWASVRITLVDERFVAPNHSASNERLVSETLLQNNAAAATFLGLRGADATPKEAALVANKRLAGLTLPFDAVVLGMGNDGHTASWFAGAEGLGAALDSQNTARCAPIRAPQNPITGEHTERLTLTLSALKNARLCVLALKGQSKSDAYEQALHAGPIQDMPVRAILRAPMGAFWPCWAP